jgi:hypothetical protein
MTWHRGGWGSRDDAADGDAAAEGPPPWRSGAELTPLEDARRVVLDRWDDELTPDELAAKRPPDEALRRAHRRAALERLANYGLFVIAVLGAAAGVAVAWMHVLGDPLADAHAYYEAAARLNAGQPLYPPGIDPNSNHIYLYPPLLAVLLRPLALLPYEWFALVWELFVVGTFVVLVRYLGVRRRSTWIAIGILGLPIGWALSVAQAHVPMTLLLAIGQPWSVAVAANIKLFPAVIVLYWLGRREWQSAAAFVLWAGLIALAQLAIEPGGTIAYLRQLGLEQLGEEGVLHNISPFTVSPVLWLVLAFLGCALTIVAARYRVGWAVAVGFATLAPPRLLVYMLTGLLAAVRQPRAPGSGEQEGDDDPAVVYRRATR